MVHIHLEIKDKNLERELNIYTAQNDFNSKTEAIIKILTEKFKEKIEPKKKGILRHLQDVDKTIKEMTE